MATKTKASPPPIAPGELSPLEVHALMISGKKATKKRDHLVAGKDQGVDVTVRVHGTIDVGEAQSQPTTETPGAEDVLALILNKLPDEMRTRAVRAVVRLYGPYRKGQDAPTITGTVKKQAEALLASLSRAATRPVRGNVVGKLQVELVTRGAPKAAAA